MGSTFIVISPGVASTLIVVAPGMGSTLIVVAPGMASTLIVVAAFRGDARCFSRFSFVESNDSLLSLRR